MFDSVVTGGNKCILCTLGNGYGRLQSPALDSKSALLLIGRSSSRGGQRKRCISRP